MRRSPAQPGGSSRALRSRARTRPRRAGGAGSRLRARTPRHPAAARGCDASPWRLNEHGSRSIASGTLEPDGEPAEHRARIPGREVDVGNAARRLPRQARREEELRLAPLDIREILDAREQLDDPVAVARRQIEERVATRRLMAVFVGEAAA